MARDGTVSEGDNEAQNRTPVSQTLRHRGWGAVVKGHGTSCPRSIKEVPEGKEIIFFHWGSKLGVCEHETAAHHLGVCLR